MAPLRHRGLIVIALGMLAAIVFEVITITAQTAPRQPLTRVALVGVLPNSAPALTWTNASPDPSGGPIDLTDRQPVLAAACTGGGAIDITLSTTTTITIDCTHSTTTGPYTLGHPASTSSESITVNASDGNPRYIVELAATNG